MTHQSNDRREAFRLAVELKACDRATAGRLWNCTDIMPRDLCADLDLPPGSTFARGARRVRATDANWQSGRRVR
jgi:hypothetical protein